jgi:hypothetical protein
MVVAFPISSSVVILLILYVLNNSFGTTLGAISNPSLGASNPTLGAGITASATTSTTTTNAATTTTTAAASTPSVQTTVQPIMNGGLTATGGNPSVLPANQLTPGASVSVNCIKGLKYNDVDLFSCIEDNHPAQTTIKGVKDATPAKVATTAAKPKTTSTTPAKPKPKPKATPAKTTAKKTTTSKPAPKKIPAKAVPAKKKK